MSFITVRSCVLKIGIPRCEFARELSVVIQMSLIHAIGEIERPDSSLGH